MITVDPKWKTAAREWYATFVLNHGCVLMGYLVSFPACLIPQIRLELNDVNTLTESILGSITPFVVAICTFITANVIGSTGRKPMYQLSLVVFAIGMAIIVFSPSINFLYAGFAVASFAAGFFTPITVTYVSEICHKKRRGVLLSTMYISTNLGGSLIFILNPYLHWRAMAAIAFAVSVIGLTQSFVLPESKYWYLLRGDKTRAIRALKWYQPDCDRYETDRILCEISQTLRTARDNKAAVGTGKFIKTVLTDWTYFKPILLGVTINLLRNGNGRGIFAVYFIDILRELRVDSTVDADTLAYWYGIVSIVSTIAILILIYKLSRKCVLYLSSTLVAASLLVIVARDPLLNDFHLVLPSSVLVVCVYTYMLLVTTSYNSTISIVVSEIQIATHRAQTVAFHTGVSYLFHCLYVFGYPYALKIMPMSYILLVFVGNVVVGVVVFYAFVPETSKFEFYENDKRNDNRSSETDGKKERY